MDRYPKLVFTCEGDGIYALGAGKNPVAEIRRLDTGETVGYGPMQFMSIVAHTDMGEWEEVLEAEGGTVEPRPDLWPLSDEDRREIQQRVRGLLRGSRKVIQKRYGQGPSPQRVLEFIFARANWESLGLSDGLDQGFRHLVREGQLEVIAPLLTDLEKA
jgi:hypothetical protein